jgi:hypothetical protein
MVRLADASRLTEVILLNHCQQSAEQLQVRRRRVALNTPGWAAAGSGPLSSAPAGNNETTEWCRTTLSDRMGAGWN